MPKDRKRQPSERRDVPPTTTTYRRGPTGTYRKGKYDFFGGFKKDDRKDRKTRRSDRKKQQSGGKRRSKRRY